MPQSKMNNPKNELHDRSSRLTSMLILFVLKQFSTREKPMSIQDIRDRLRMTFYDQPTDSVPDIKTIRNQLQQMMDFLQKNGQDMATNKQLNFGFNIILCGITKDGKLVYDDHADIMGNTNDLTSYDIAQRKGTLQSTQYYYYKNIFDHSEVNLLIQSLQSFNYLSSRDISTLILKLQNLNPHAEGQNPYSQKNTAKNDPRLNDNDARLLENMQTLHDIISEQGFAKITLGYYDAEHRLDDYEPQKEYLVRPLQMIFNNGYYYLIASQYSKRKKQCFANHFRIDRLTYIDPYDEEDPVPNRDLYQNPVDFQQTDSASYRLHHPVMYGDELIHVDMLVENSEYMLNVLMDIFGTAADITPYIPKKTQENMIGKWLSVSLKQVAKGGVHLFATEYCSKVRIIRPKELAREVSQELQNALALYQPP